jgi:hypothetical protein
MSAKPLLSTVLATGLAAWMGCIIATVNADQVLMRNGDRFNGQVSAVDEQTVTVRSETLGNLKLPRSKVLTISLGQDTSKPAGVASTNGAVGLGLAPTTNKAPETSSLLKQLAANTNLVQQVQAQFLAGAGPESNAKFNELLNGLLSGKISVEDIRSQARVAADQIRNAKQELGDDAGLALDGYLTILDHFLKESAPATTGPKGSPSTTKNRAAVAEEE